MKKISSKQKELFVECFIDGLVILGLLFIISPWLKDSMIGWQIQRTELVQQKVLPTEIPVEEAIKTPQLSSIFKNSTQSTQEGYGKIMIPSVGLAQPILVGITNEHLLLGGVAMYPDRTLAEDNFVLFGHHLGINELLFGKLLEVKEHDQILVNYLDEEQVYEVEHLTIVDETTLSVLETHNEALLTLITCPIPQSTQQRLVITAKPVEENKQKTRIAAIKDAEDQDLVIKRKQKLVNKKLWRMPIVFFILCLLALSFIRWLFYKKKK